MSEISILTEEARSSDVKILASPKSPRRISWSFVKNMFEHCNQTSRFCISKFQNTEIINTLCNARNQTSTTNLDIAMENVIGVQVFKSHQELYQPLAEFLKTKEEEVFRTLCTNLKPFRKQMCVKHLFREAYAVGFLYCFGPVVEIKRCIRNPFRVKTGQKNSEKETTVYMSPPLQ